MILVIIFKFDPSYNWVDIYTMSMYIVLYYNRHYKIIFLLVRNQLEKCKHNHKHYFGYFKLQLENVNSYLHDIYAHKCIYNRCLTASVAVTDLIGRAVGGGIFICETQNTCSEIISVNCEFSISYSPPRQDVPS